MALRIGIFESVCGGLLCMPPDCLIREGWSMLSAIGRILRIDSEIEVVTILDPAILSLEQATPIFEVFTLPGDATDFDARLDAWKGVVTNLDAILIIAPEIDGQLERVLETFDTANIPTLNCDVDFVQFASDKWQLAQFCTEKHIAHPETWLLADFDATMVSQESPFILKPRRGAGCVDLLKFYDALSLANHVRHDCVRFEEGDRWLVQRFVHGTAASQSVLVDNTGQINYFPLMRQNLMELVETESKSVRLDFIDSSLFAADNETNDDLELEAKSKNVIRPVLHKFKASCFGWIGFDLVVGEDGGVTLIEANPRLSTSIIDVQKVCASLERTICRTLKERIKFYIGTESMNQSNKQVEATSEPEPSPAEPQTLHASLSGEHLIDMESIWTAMIGTPKIGVCILCREGKFLYANKASRELLTGSAEIELEGKYIADFQPIGFVNERLKIINRVLDESKPISVRHILVGRSIESTFWPIDDHEAPFDRVIVITNVCGPQHRQMEDSSVESVATEFIGLGPLNVLTRRELEVMVLLGHGMSVPRVAKLLHRSPKTIERHKASVTKKLHLHGQADLVQIVTAMGLEFSDATLKRLPDIEVQVMDRADINDQHR